VIICRDFIVNAAIRYCTRGASGQRRFTHLFARFLLSCLSGIAGWTFVEYVLRRFVLHSIEAAAQMHDMRHRLAIRQARQSLGIEGPLTSIARSHKPRWDGGYRKAAKSLRQWRTRK
jgi:hypothetical protein